MTRDSITVPVKSGILYFVIVFGAGFVLGAIRLLWAVPHFGARRAELMEMPVMLVVVIVAARSIVHRLGVASTPAHRLGMGSIALALLVGAELALTFPVRGLSIREYVARQDPVSGAVYLAMLGAFAIMPLLVAGVGARRSRLPDAERS